MFKNCEKPKLVFPLCYVLIIFVLCSFELKNLSLAAPHQEFNKPIENFSSTYVFRRKLLSVEQTQNVSRPGILEFPWDGFTREERQHGWITVHIIVMCYGLWFLASICDSYLVPSIEEICADFHVNNTVIKTAIMAAAACCPELFMNCIDTFATTGNTGVGTIVGSAVFNILIVPACCGIIVNSYLKLDSRAITGDALMYMLAILALWVISRDGQVWWYEALSLVIIYISYIILLYYKPKLGRMSRSFLKRCGYYKPQYTEVTEFTKLLVTTRYVKSNYMGIKSVEENLEQERTRLKPQETNEFMAAPWTSPKQDHEKVLFYWPVKCLLWLIMPSCSNKYWQYWTFILSLLLIAGITYVVTFVANIIGDTFNIPDAIMGLIFLAAGTGIPDVISCINAAKLDQGSMKMNESLSCNIFEILIGLGLPWFMKALLLPEIPGENQLPVDTTSFTYVTLLLSSSLVIFCVLLVGNKFVLNRCLAVSCIILYIGLMITVILFELQLFFPVT